MRWKTGRERGNSNDASSVLICETKCPSIYMYFCTYVHVWTFFNLSICFVYGCVCAVVYVFLSKQHGQEYL